ncbi:MAG: NAD(P)/FAD-dependent oxidoreductase [bacterium]
MDNLDIAIIGGGPSGIAAAIQLKRCGYSPVLFEKYKIGGLIRSAHLVENYPGFSIGITGIVLAEKLESHLKKWQVEVYKQEVEKVDYQDDLFKISTGCAQYLTRILLVASGTIPKKLNISKLCLNNEDKVFYEIEPLLRIKNKHICIIGGGDAAFDYALNLAEHNNISILYPSTNPRCLPLLYQRVCRNKSIKCINEVTIDNIRTENNNLTLKGLKKDHFIEIVGSCLLVAIGREENLKFIGNSLLVNKTKLENSKKLFFIGDVKNGIFRQISLAAADGIKAAMEIHIKNQGLK